MSFLRKQYSFGTQEQLDLLFGRNRHGHAEFTMVAHPHEEELELRRCHFLLVELLFLAGYKLDDLFWLVFLHHPHRNHRSGILGLVGVDQPQSSYSADHICEVQLDSSYEQIEVTLRIEQFDGLLVGDMAFVSVANLDHHNKQWWLDLALLKLILSALPIGQQIPHIPVIINWCFL